MPNIEIKTIPRQKYPTITLIGASYSTSNEIKKKKKRLRTIQNYLFKLIEIILNFAIFVQYGLKFLSF